MKTKYHNKPCVYEGIKFPSEHERDRYIELKLLLRAGKIHNLRRQVRYKLIDTQRDKNGKVLEMPTFYIADFVYEQDGAEVVEDAKGYSTDVFIIKRKLMLKVHGIRVKIT